jgi:hypothetical protein
MYDLEESIMNMGNANTFMTLFYMTNTVQPRFTLQFTQPMFSAIYTELQQYIQKYGYSTVEQVVCRKVIPEVKSLYLSSGA